MSNARFQVEDLPPILTAAAMRGADEHTIDSVGIAGSTLMESAGREVVRVAKELTPDGRDAHVVCLCGKGNNGGDGFVVARYLAQAGGKVSVVAISPRSAFKGDALLNLQILERLSEQKLAPFLTIEFFPDKPRFPENPDLIIDALLGTGLSSEVLPPLASAIEWANEQKAQILSVDIPSGLSADSGDILGITIRADATVTLGSLKAGLVLGSGPDVSGEVSVADIGIPGPVLSSRALVPGCAFLSRDEYVRPRLSPRRRSGHKYSNGLSIVAGGSSSFPGAVTLAARGAARAGSGYVICLAPWSIRDLLLKKLDEIPVEGWEENANQSNVAKLITRLENRWTKAQALLVGPGLGRDPAASTITRELLQHFDGPAVIDADALFALQDERDWVSKRADGNWIFTPHEGEFMRLAGEKKPTVNRIEMAQRFAREWNVVVLLKGMPSITAAPDGSTVVNSTGNPSVSTAGSGDILAGIVTGLLAQGLSAFEAAVCGVHVAGTAADQFVEEHASQSLVASDILDALPSALLRFS